MELKPGYKQTEIGVIPEDWDFVQLKNCIDLKNGYAFQSVYFSDRGEVLLTPGNFSRTGGLQFDSTNTKQYNGKFPKDSVLSYGDLLLVMTDLTPDCKLLGKPAIVKTKEPLLHNQRIAKVVNNQRKAVNGFLFYVFLSEHYLRYLKDRATGSTVRHTSLRIISSFRTALPPKKEQIAVSKTLSDIDSLITSIEKLIEKKKLIKQGVMQELLTGKSRLPGFSGEWETKRLGDLCSHITTGRKDVNEGNPNGMYPFFTCSRAITYSDHFSFDTEAILIAGNGDVGTLHYFTGKFEAYQRTYVLSGFNVKARYLVHYLNMYLVPTLCDSKIGTSIPYIKIGDLINMPVIVPIDDTEVKHVISVIDDIELEIDMHVVQLKKHELLKQAMMQELLTGRIRLI